MKHLHRLIWICLGAATFVKLGQFHAKGMWPFSSAGHIKLGDFSSFWAAAVRVVNGDAPLVYDTKLHDAFQSALLHQAPLGAPFPYPPHALILLAPLGFFTVGQAWLLFVLPSAALYFFILRKICCDSPSAFGMTFAIGGATEVLTLGQNGFWSASLLVGGLLLLPRHKNLAGNAFGLLTFKPHLGLALAGALLLWREWRTIAVAVATTAALALIATLSFGSAVWVGFLNASGEIPGLLSARQHIIVEPMMQSVFALALPRVGAQGAAFAQGAAALLAFAAIARVSRLSADFNVRCASVIAATLLIPPYLFLYDTTMLTATGALLLINASRSEQVAVFFALLIPGAWYLGIPAPAPFAALILLSLAYKRALDRRDTITPGHDRTPARAGWHAQMDRATSTAR